MPLSTSSTSAPVGDGISEIALTALLWASYSAERKAFICPISKKIRSPTDLISWSTATDRDTSFEESSCDCICQFLLKLAPSIIATDVDATPCPLGTRVIIKRRGDCFVFTFFLLRCKNELLSARRVFVF